MTLLSSSEIDHLANLARLSLSDEEKERFAQQLPEIIEFVDQLQRVTLDQQAPTKQVVELDKLRADEPNSESLTLEQIEQLAAPDFQDNQLVVPAVFGEADNA